MYRFFIALFLTISGFLNAGIEVIEIPSEIGAGTRGASLGPSAIKTAALTAESDFFREYRCTPVAARNEALHYGDQSSKAKRIETLLEIYERVSRAVQEKLRDPDTFLVILAGDHSTAGGTIAGVKMADPKKRVGVIWIDAHADIHSPYTTPSGNTHGMPVATALAEDNLENRKNVLDAKTQRHWEQMKNVGGIAPKILPSDLVYFAVRDTEKEEDALLEKHRIKNFTVPEIREKGAKTAARMALEKLSGCDIIYISFDVDGMDCSLSRGTGTPVPYGITDMEAADIITELVKSPKVRCLEITEVNPLLDDGNRMGEIAFKILLKTKDQLSSRK